jgi:hypothetical protein
VTPEPKLAPQGDAVAWALTHPHALVAWSPAQWEPLVAAARRANLLARLAERMHDGGWLNDLPERVQAHLIAERTLAAAQQRDVVREINHVLDALHPVGVEPVLLKGAAYVAAQLPAAKGRLFADVDILVDASVLAQTEAALMQAGWASTHPDAYDQRYYRQWMHEIPPMVHIHRHTTLDVHHAISPRTARRVQDPQRLTASAVRVPFNDRSVLVLSEPDRVLHSMVHLLQNEVMTHALRDLSDMDALLRQGQSQQGFWTGLSQRAHELNMRDVLDWGLCHVARCFGTPVPHVLLTDGPTSTRARHPWMDAVWRHALRSPQPPGRGATAQSIANAVVYARAHGQRMPPWRLTKHLLIKGWRGATASLSRDQSIKT